MAHFGGQGVNVFMCHPLTMIRSKVCQLSTYTHVDHGGMMRSSACASAISAGEEGTARKLLRPRPRNVQQISVQQNVSLVELGWETLSKLEG